MLVIVTGSETVGRALFTRKLLVDLNQLNQKYESGGFVVELGNGSVEIFKDTNLVYKNGNSGDSGVIVNDEFESTELIQQLTEVDTALNEFIASAACLDDYSSAGHDVGIAVADSEVSYTKLVEMYNASEYEYTVVHGVFSAFALEQIKQLIEDVIVVNITRHPSVVALLELAETKEDNRQFTISPTGFIDDLNLRDWTVDSLIHSQTIQKLPFAHTFSFESFIANSKFELNGTTHNMPMYVPFNEWVTVYEKELIDKLTQNSGLDMITSYVNLFNTVFDVPTTNFTVVASDKQLPNFSMNLFEYTTYNTSLTVDTILNSN